MRRRSAAFGGLVLGGMLTSCVGQEAPTLRVLVRDRVISLDPHAVDDRLTEAVLFNVYDALVDLGGGYVPSLATAWSNPAKGVWRFVLREGVFFHDGRSFTARDVEYSIERGMEQAGSSAAHHLASIASVRSTGPHSIEIRTRGPSPLLLNNLSQVAVLPYGGVPTDAATAVGTGSYRVLAWGEGGGLELERFGSSWREAPDWQVVSVRSNPDGHARVEALRSGEADLVDYPPESLLESLRTSPGTQVIERPAPRIAILGLLLRQRTGNPFEDPNVRRAVSLGIDRQALVAGALQGWGKVPTQIAPAGVFGYVDSWPALEHDPEAARAALAASGYPAGAHAKLGFSEQNRVLAEAVAEQLSGIGIELELDPTPWVELEPRMQRQEVPAYVFHMSYNDLDTWSVLVGGFHSRGEDGNGAINFSGYQDSEMDELLEQAAVSVEPLTRADLLRRAMEKAMGSHAWIPLSVRSFLWAARPGLSWEPSLTLDLELDRIREKP